MIFDHKINIIFSTVFKSQNSTYMKTHHPRAAMRGNLFLCYTTLRICNAFKEQNRIGELVDAVRSRQ